MPNILTPEQGAYWKAGEIQEIRWHSQNIDGQVAIYLSRQAGLSGSFETITSTTINDGKYTWIVEGDASNHCMIKIVPNNEPSKGTTQGLFRIDNFSSGLLTYYPFNGNHMDYSGKNNHASAKGNLSTIDKLSNPNCAYHLDGKKDYINISSLTSDMTDDHGISFSFWIKPHQLTQTGNQTLVSFSENFNNTNPRMEIYLQNNVLFFEHIQPTKNVSVSTDGVITNNAWYFISVVCDLFKTILYVNGVETARGPGSENTNLFSHAFVGKRAFAGENDYFCGDIDDFRIYERSISENEITDLYQLKILTVQPNAMWLPSNAGSIQITVMNTGAGIMNWTAGAFEKRG